MEAVVFMLAPLAACLTLVGIHGYFGIHVLKREIIFIDIALAQVAAVGSIIALVVFKAEHHSIFPYVCALGLTITAAGFFTIAGRKITQISLETVIGVSYAIAAAGALFLVAMSSEGHLHVEQMLAGSILWTKWPDIFLCAGVFFAVGLLFYFFRSRFEKMSREYIICDILEERKRQDEKWGEQNHSPMEWLPILMEEVGEASKAALDFYFGNTTSVCVDDFRNEMVQVAAVAVAMIESFDRNEGIKK